MNYCEICGCDEYYTRCYNCRMMMCTECVLACDACYNFVCKECIEFYDTFANRYNGRGICTLCDYAIYYICAYKIVKYAFKSKRVMFLACDHRIIKIAFIL